MKSVGAEISQLDIMLIGLLASAGHWETLQGIDVTHVEEELWNCLETSFVEQFSWLAAMKHKEVTASMVTASMAIYYWRIDATWSVNQSNYSI